MTAYSFAVSELRNKNFKEPHLLGTMLRRLVITDSSRSSKLTGWAIHFLVGVALAASYDLLSRKLTLEPTLPKGAVIGGLTGILGSLAWHVTLQNHPFPPAMDRKRFYGQLIIAHVIFGIVTISLLRMLNRKAGTLKLNQRKQLRQAIY